MKAKLDGIYSPNLPSGYDELPPDPSNCWVVVHADIGSQNGLGSDCFTVYVSTPTFLAKCLETSNAQFGHGLLIVSEFNWAIVEDAIQRICTTVEAETWPELVQELARLFVYEYE